MAKGELVAELWRLAHESEDLAPRRVLADALTEIGDSFGEFMSLQLAGQDVEAARLLERELPRWFPWAPDITAARCRFDRGLLSELQVDRAPPSRLGAWARSLERLVIDSGDPTAMLLGLPRLTCLWLAKAPPGTTLFPSVRVVGLPVSAWLAAGTPARLHATFPSLAMVALRGSHGDPEALLGPTTRLAAIGFAADALPLRALLVAWQRGLGPQELRFAFGDVRSPGAGTWCARVHADRSTTATVWWRGGNDEGRGHHSEVVDRLRHAGIRMIELGPDGGTRQLDRSPPRFDTPPEGRQDSRALFG